MLREGRLRTENNTGKSGRKFRTSRRFTFNLFERGAETITTPRKTETERTRERELTPFLPVRGVKVHNFIALCRLTYTYAS